MGNSISHSTVRIILVPNVLSSNAPLLKQRSTRAKGYDPIDIIFLAFCCQPNTQTTATDIPTFASISNIDLKDLIDAADSNIYVNITSNDKDL